MAKQIMTMRCCWPSSSSSWPLQFLPLRRRLALPLSASLTSPATDTDTDTKRHRKEKPKGKARDTGRKRGGDQEKRRTRSERDYSSSPDEDGGARSHVPVMLGEVVDVFSSSLPLRSFVDCTLGAAGHSSAIIESHPELEYFVGIDVDPIAHEKARAHIDALLHSSQCHSGLKVHTPLQNFRFIKSVLNEVDGNLLRCGVDGILMDLGMSSMQVNNPERGFSLHADGPLDMRMDPQASLKAKDILNSWPDDEVGRVLREYGEESNWRVLQKKIVQERLYGGLHYTTDLVDLIQGVSRGSRGGRQGWIKTATRVFQALRIAVNDELNTLDESLHACFECLAPGGRLAVISFHSLEDRMVKQTFLNIINGEENENEEEDVRGGTDVEKIRSDDAITKGTWIRQIVQGKNGTILTKRPITPSQSEERSNRRSRSAKLRVIEKLRS